MTNSKPCPEQRRRIKNSKLSSEFSVSSVAKNDPSQARFIKKLMRDPFELLLKKVRAGEFITPAFFHKCTIPHSFHVFQRYHFRQHPFDQYMKKHKVPLRAPTATQLHKMTLSALSRLAKSGSAGSLSVVAAGEGGYSPAVIRGTGVSPVNCIGDTGVSPVIVNRPSSIDNSKLLSVFSPMPNIRKNTDFNARLFKTNPIQIVHRQSSIDNSKLFSLNPCKEIARAQYGRINRADGRTSLLGVAAPRFRLSASKACSDFLNPRNLRNLWFQKRHNVVKSNPILDNRKTFFSKVPDT